MGPDIRFVKSNTNSTDNIYFPEFLLASYPLTGDVTPVDYVRYQCTGVNLPYEDYKCFQFPITQKVKNLSNTLMTFGIWAAVATTPANINIYAVQYFGSGTAASTPVRSLIGTASLTTSWDWFPFTLTIPSVAGKSLGTPGQTTNDDALYIQVEMPIGLPCDIYFTKPALFLGNVDPELEFDSYDQIDSINQTPRTGDVRATYWTSAPLGWVPMNDGSIGNAGSLASIRDNQDTFQLYKTVYDSVIDTWAPVSGGRTGNATNDFIAGKTLTLPRALGRVLAEAGAGSGLTATALGQWSGAEANNITLAAANLPPHSHTYTYNNLVGVNGFGYAQGTLRQATSLATGNGPGTSTPFAVPTMQPATYMNFYIKL